ncbi:hypothetical protein NDU88_003008 [Pleurodeles waltl]|uniref:Uncharacterized protein n=1 Tax=Pleurodeles waltl TaxID=8319 RepID=A0AAV7M5V5_PLEWA|nr:hypothetical protein NDU88_003008 [Pleurodeles waltl]
MAATEVSSGPGPACPDSPPHTEPTLRDIMMAIQIVKDTLEPKVDRVTLEVNRIRADLKKVTEKLTVAESQILGLQSVMKCQEEQVQNLTKQTTVLTARLEEQKGRKQWKCFDDVKCVLREKELKYMMLFPAKLKIIAEGKTWLFSTPEEAWDWLEGWRVQRKKQGTRRILQDPQPGRSSHRLLGES